MALESWRYGNPLHVLEREENGTCKGCVSNKRIEAFEYICVSEKVTPSQRFLFKKCKYFKESK